MRRSHLKNSFQSRLGLLAGLAGILLAACVPLTPRPETATLPAQIDFAREIRPIFNKNCVACHGGVKVANGVSFIVRERALAPAKSGETPIRPGDLDHSELVRRVTSKDNEERMPPPEHGPALSAREIALLKEWIKQGAEWKEHWAYVAPKLQTLPRVSDPQWSRQPLDRFVLARLEKEKLKPARPADRLQWLRRASFDLTGLPPTPAEIQSFRDDTNADAFEKVADRLLASPAFGERWAAPWLDLARYADTQGYEKDGGRTVWPYRDWLIRAFNADMPYDQFIVRQLAGDLLPDATLDDQVATVFHRNTQTNAEGGTDDEEYRLSAVLDRVNTTWEVVQGVTFRCVQCHSHPYDPIEHEDYYRFIAVFNTSRDWDLDNEAPVLRVPTNSVDYAKARELDLQLAALQSEEHRQVESVVAAAANAWQPLNPSRAESTKLTKLEIKQDGDVTEVLTAGTLSAGSRFTIDIPIPESVKRLTALRIEALPRNLEAARLTPESGFIVSHLRAYIIDPNSPPAEEKEIASETPKNKTEIAPAQNNTAAAPAGTAKEEPKPKPETPPGKEIRFARVIGDETHPLYDPDASLNADRQGWGSLPRIDRPRRGVFAATEPADLPAGSSLRVTLLFDAAASEAPQVINRGRFSISQDDRWTQLAKDETFESRRKELAVVRQTRAKIGSVEIPVMAEQDDRLRRVTSVFTRGNWLDKGAVVSPGVPKLFPPLPGNTATNRLAIARWLVSRENPLAARVAVNRFWEQLFGVGLVETLEDFGSSGMAPSHPELLDALALRFQNELNWSVKKLLREIVLSATYRQDALVRPELLKKDPRNRLLARGPRTRLTAEMVRDQALALSGLLSPKMYGPPVMPLQPAGVWRSVYNSAKWETSKGEDQYRRAVYTYWKRTAGYPGFVSFDMPSREVCTARRLPTNTPLQALVTMNDPAYIECAQVLAKRMTTDGGANAKDHISRGWELAVGVRPSEADLNSLLGLYERSLNKFKSDSAEAEKLADTPELAALTVVANALLNLDGLLTK